MKNNGRNTTTYKESAFLCMKMTNGFETKVVHKKIDKPGDSLI